MEFSNEYGYASPSPEDQQSADALQAEFLEKLSTGCLITELGRRGYKVVTESFLLPAVYQADCQLTEAPIQDDPAAIIRWKAAWKPALQNLGRVLSCITKSRLDATKKYAAYNKQPTDLMGTSYESFDSRPWEAGNFADCDDPEVFRLLHGLLGKVTELEEMLNSFLQSCSRIQTEEGHCYTSRDIVTIEDIDRINFGEELGDDNWYNALICNALKLSLQSVLEANQEKLMTRYRAKVKQRGQEVADELGLKFSPENANNRDIPAEQAGLKTTIDYRSFGEDPLTPAEMVILTTDQKEALKKAWNDLYEGTSVSFLTEPNPPLYCTYCESTGHLMDDCPDKIPAVMEDLILPPSIDTAEAPPVFDPLVDGKFKFL